MEIKELFPSPLGVIFSLIKDIKLINSVLDTIGFRLLSELYSLLCSKLIYILEEIVEWRFRLLSELYSLLFIIKVAFI